VLPSAARTAGTTSAHRSRARQSIEEVIFMGGF
jgi:hypothetical protein